MADVEMTFIEHLAELRTRLIRSLYGLGAFFVMGFIMRKWLLEQLMKPLPKDIHLQVLVPHEPFMASIRLATYTALFLGLPIILYQATMFVLPALKDVERKVILSSIVFGTVLAFLGFAFAYWVILPVIFPALRSFLPITGLDNNYRLTEFMKFVGTIVLGFGAAFQVPIVVVILAKLGILPVRVLAKNTPIVVLVLAVISALLTPADLPSMLMMFVPLMALYAVGLGVAAIITRKKADES